MTSGEQEPFFEPGETNAMGMLAKILGGVGIAAATGVTVYVVKKLTDNHKEVASALDSEDDDEDI